MTLMLLKMLTKDRQRRVISPNVDGDTRFRFISQYILGFSVWVTMLDARMIHLFLTHFHLMFFPMAEIIDYLFENKTYRKTKNILSTFIHTVKAVISFYIVLKIYL